MQTMATPFSTRYDAASGAKKGFARKANVSDSSVIRLCRTLGYSGFLDLQNDIQGQMLQHIEDGTDTLLSPIQKLNEKTSGFKKSDIITTHLNYSIANLQSVIEKNTSEKFDAIASILVQSRQKFISGFRGCRGLADWTALILGHMLPNVRRNTSAGSDVLEALLDLSANDCVLVISFHRYAHAAIDTVTFAKSKGAKVVVITDKLTSPVASGADQVVIVDVQGLSFFNSLVAASFAVELILGAVNKAIGTSNHDRLSVLDAYVSLHGFY